MSLRRKQWGREHAWIGKCVSALTQPRKVFPFALLKSNSHHLCSSFTTLSVLTQGSSWVRDFPLVSASHVAGTPMKKDMKLNSERSEMWYRVKTFSLAVSLPQPLSLGFLTLMFFLWTFSSSTKCYFVCGRSMCHWSAYSPCRVWIKFIDTFFPSIRISINCYSFTFPNFTKRSCLVLSSVAVQLSGGWMSQKATVLLLWFFNSWETTAFIFCTIT